MDKKNSPGMNIGTSSILVTFVLLCLVTFSTLAYMSARSDYKLSEQTAERTTKYYDANRLAEINMANIEGLLAKYCSNCADEDEYLAGIEGVFADNESITVTRNGDEVDIGYQVSIDDAQKIDVVLTAHYPDLKDGTLFHIEKWATSIDDEYMNELKNESEDADGPKFMF